MSSNWQCIRYQLYEFTIIKKSRDKRKKTRTNTNYKKYEMKWNNKSYKKNEKNKHEHYWSSRTNNIQQNENAETQDYARNELIMTA